MNTIQTRRLMIEFVAIVLGVLVALAVDEWRNGIRDRGTEAQYVERLIGDLSRDSTLMTSATRIGARKLVALDEAIQKLGDTALVGETPTAVWPDLSYTHNRPELQTTTFDDLLSTGNLSLIHDADIRFEIGNHYSRVAIHSTRLDRRRTELGRVVTDLFPPVSGSTANDPLSDATLRAALDSAFFAAPNASQRLERLHGPEYQGLLHQERLYAQSIVDISTMILGFTSDLLGVLREYQRTEF